MADIRDTGLTGNSGIKTSGIIARPQSIVTLTADDEAHRFDKERIVIGSVVSADMRLPENGVSPIHAVLEMSHGEVTIYDLASDSGVFVNGQKVITKVLRSGDRVKIGGNEIHFEINAAVEKAKDRASLLNPTEDFTPLLLEPDRPVEEIFDYRPTQSKRAVEVVMSWYGTVLDVSHFVDQKEITLGNSPKADFGIPPILSSPKFPLVSKVGDSYTLQVDPRMKVVVQSKGQLRHIGDATHVSQVNFGKDDFAKITLGDIDFYLSFTAAPPTVKTKLFTERDPLFFKIFWSSMLLTVLVMTALIRAHVPQNLDAEQLPDRIATILYQPEKYAYHSDQKYVVDNVSNATPPTPEQTKTPQPQTTTKLDINPNPNLNPNVPVPKEMNAANKSVGKNTANQHKGGTQVGQQEAKEGEGAKSKGTSGTRGSKKAAPGKDQQTAAMRPSPEGGKGRGGGQSQVSDNGNVDFLKGVDGQIEKIIGDTAAHLGKSGEKLKGFGGFNTLGNGGLALSGSGTGGGGTADNLVGGLSDKGVGGGKIGTGRGATGTGSAIIGGSSRVSIRQGGPEETVVSGSIDADAVEAALLAHRDEFRLCYEREINAETPNASGRVGTNFVIGSSGRVTQAGVLSTTLHNSNTERCILDVIKRINFPIPRGAGVVEVSYPFKFVSNR